MHSIDSVYICLFFFFFFTICVLTLFEDDAAEAFVSSPPFMLAEVCLLAICLF
jgi:hypothetical protein